MTGWIELIVEWLKDNRFYPEVLPPRSPHGADATDIKFVYAGELFNVSVCANDVVIWKVVVYGCPHTKVGEIPISPLEDPSTDPSDVFRFISSTLDEHVPCTIKWRHMEEWA